MMGQLAPLMRFTRPPRLLWHKQPPPESGIIWCGLCQCPSPRLFDVPDEVWLHYLGPDQRHQVVCIQCWCRLTSVIEARVSADLSVAVSEDVLDHLDLNIVPEVAA